MPKFSATIDAFLQKYERILQAILVSMLVPVLLLLADPTKMNDFLNLFDTKMPPIIHSMVTSALMGLVGNILYRMVPSKVPANLVNVAALAAPQAVVDTKAVAAAVADVLTAPRTDAK